MDSSMNEIIMELVRAFLWAASSVPWYRFCWTAQNDAGPGHGSTGCDRQYLRLAWAYEPFLKWAGAGAGVPLLGFGNTLWTGVAKAVGEEGPLGFSEAA